MTSIQNENENINNNNNKIYNITTNNKNNENTIYVNNLFLIIHMKIKNNKK